MLFNIGMILHEWGRFGEALPYLTESLARSHPADSIVRKLYALISQCQRRLGRPDDALTTCREGQMRYPHDLELLFHESVVLKELGDRPGSEGCLLRLLYAEEGDHFGSVNPELRGSIARHNLAVLYREEGRVAEAESYWQAVVTDAPAYLPAWLGLAELYLEQERWPEWEDATASMEAEPTAWLDAAVMRGRGLLARGDHASARRLLEDATVRAPTAVLPRVLLSHVLLKEGRDMAAAERVLREVLALAPEHTEARHNLAILRRQPAAS